MFCLECFYFLLVINSSNNFISDKGLLFETAKELLFQERMKESVRLLGISLNNLNTEVKKTVVVQLRFEF